MTRLGIVMAVLLALGTMPGCSVCCTPFDDAYPTYGGKWARTDQFRGRVGSAFDPAGPFPGDTELTEPTPARPQGNPLEMDGILDEELPMPDVRGFEGEFEEELE